MSERRQQAWDEAQRRYPPGDRQAGFVSGAAWADDNPAPRVITRKRARAVAAKASDRFGGIVDPDAVRLLLGVAFLELGIEVVDTNPPAPPEEPEVHVVECRGGCARVFDKPRPDPLFVCRQCRIRMGQDV